jgi:hypothetical protein
MAKIVYVCVRNPANVPMIKKKVESITKKLIPENIPNAPCKIEEINTIIYGIATYTSSIKEKDGSVCMGLAYNGSEKWWQPLAKHPDGSYAIFRNNEDFVEILTDVAGSRAVWYYKDDEIFITGTSQRAVIAVAGKFDFDKRIIPWVLSTGSSGPSFTWCKNIYQAPPDCSILLNRKNWELSIHTEKHKWAPVTLTEKEHYTGLKQVMIDSFNDLNIDFSNWVLPISGGYDSRSIACLLKETKKDISKLNTITWGLKDSLGDPKNDAYLGAAIAKSLGLNHQYLETDNLKGTIENIFNRFIHSSEGRIDHIAGYTDGFEIWKNIFESGRHGILRGDENFGWEKVLSANRCRFLNGLTLCSDFSNLENFEQYGYDKQVIPQPLLKKVDESFNTYCDRLYEDFRIPFIMSALSDVKLSYAEVLNPLLSKKIQDYIHTLPDQLRLDRKLYKQLVNEISPKVNYASNDATGLRENLLANSGAIKLLSDELSAAYMKELFPEVFLKMIVSKLQHPTADKNTGLLGNIKESIKKIIKKNAPIWLKEKLIANMSKPELDYGILAFRVYMTGKIFSMFTEDTKGMSDWVAEDGIGNNVTGKK